MNSIILNMINLTNNNEVNENYLANNYNQFYETNIGNLFIKLFSGNAIFLFEINIMNQSDKYSQENFESDLFSLLAWISSVKSLIPIAIHLIFAAGGEYILPTWFKNLCIEKEIMIVVRG